MLGGLRRLRGLRGLRQLNPNNVVVEKMGWQIISLLNSLQSTEK